MDVEIGEQLWRVEPLRVGELGAVLPVVNGRVVRRAPLVLEAARGAGEVDEVGPLVETGVRVTSLWFQVRAFALSHTQVEWHS